jgi:benzoate 4-monooxygenase
MTNVTAGSLLNLNSLLLLGAILSTAILAVHIVPYILDPYNLRNVPGPFWAKFTDFWLVFVSGQGHRSEVVHELHKKYGPVVRIAPNHISIADPDALQAIYGHSTGTIKSNFYDAFVSIARGLFTTRDRVEHTRKRKIVSHIFSPKNVAEFEPNVRLYVGQLIEQWDRFYDRAVKGESGQEGEGGWYGRNGRLWLDCLPCKCTAL